MFKARKLCSTSRCRLKELKEQPKKTGVGSTAKLQGLGEREYSGWLGHIVGEGLHIKKLCKMLAALGQQE